MRRAYRAREANGCAGAVHARSVYLFVDFCACSLMCACVARAVPCGGCGIGLAADAAGRNRVDAATERRDDGEGDGGHMFFAVPVYTRFIVVVLYCITWAYLCVVCVRRMK